MATASMKRDGNVTEMTLREIVTEPSSSGWRITSGTLPLKLRQLVQEEKAILAERNFPVHGLR